MKNISNSEKFFLSVDDIARERAISTASARVAASRLASRGELIRVKRNLYVTAFRWKTASENEKFLVANKLQTPSYISLLTALSYYEVTTEMQQNFYESICLKRAKEVSIREPVVTTQHPHPPLRGSRVPVAHVFDGPLQSVFRFTKITSDLYNGFTRVRGFFIAWPEKALLDALYLMGYGKYTLDIASIDRRKLDERRLAELARAFPARTREMVSAL